jgi:mRNA interferase RelE/StbE
MRRLRVPGHVAALIRSLHPDLKRKVRSALRDIVDDPAIGKPLRDDLAGLHSCRVSRFRIVYRVVGALIEIIAVGPRRTIYQETWRRVRKGKSGKDRQT